MKNKELKDSSYYLNRELSQLAFNERVLAQAQDTCVPLLERLRFLFICARNLDEFFEIRVAGLKEQVAFGIYQNSIDGLSAPETLTAVSQRTHQLVDDLYTTLNKTLFPALKEEGLHFLDAKEWNKAQRHWLKQFFREEILPIISPIGLDMAHPFPLLGNKSLNFIVTLEGTDAFGRDSGLAIVHVPRTIPRVIALPNTLNDKTKNFVLINSIIFAHADELFPGMEVTGCYPICLTRNSDLWLEMEANQDLVSALQGELLSKRYGRGVRLEVADNCPDEICHFLLKKHDLEEKDLYRIKGPVNLGRFMMILKLIERPDLSYPSFSPTFPKALTGKCDMFASIKEQDRLLHHPFESFTPVVELLHQAAADPNVIAIKQTLYRTQANSLMVDALVAAARARIEVTAVVELRARFDEEENIALANRLQEAGALVVYGVLGYKIHAKMTLILRREANNICHYLHLGTGNYHTETTKQYTDLGLLTCNPQFGQDAAKIFQQLTGMGKAVKLKALTIAPFQLAKQFHAFIQREIQQANAGKKAHIIIKVNAISEPSIIQALYEASMAGVKIDLLVRGICCLRPSIPGVSDNIRVISIVGQFLEHSRVYYFYNAGKEEIYAGSADCMSRNFFNRVEVCFPILDKQLAKRIKEETLLNYLQDNCQSWQLEPDGHYQQSTPGKHKPHRAQGFLLKKSAK